MNGGPAWARSSRFRRARRRTSIARRHRQRADQRRRQGNGRRAGAHRDRANAGPTSRRAAPTSISSCSTAPRGSRRRATNAACRRQAFATVQEDTEFTINNASSASADVVKVIAPPQPEGTRVKGFSDGLSVIERGTGAREGIAAGPQDAALFRRQGGRALRARPRHDRGLRQGHADQDAHASRRGEPVRGARRRDPVHRERQGRSGEARPGRDLRRQRPPGLRSRGRRDGRELFEFTSGGLHDGDGLVRPDHLRAHAISGASQGLRPHFSSACAPPRVRKYADV